MSNLAYKLDDQEDDNDFFERQKARQELKSQLRVIEGGGQDDEEEPEFDQEDLDNYRDAVKNKEIGDAGSENAASPEDLKEKEENSFFNEGDDEEDEDSLYKDEGKKRTKGRLRITRKQGIIGASVSALIISSAVTFFSVVSGPAKFMHLSQLLQRFHFSSQENDSGSRLMKLAKTIRNKDTPEKNRLGFIKNKLADRWEVKLKAAGVGLEYSSQTGNFRRFVIDPEVMANNSQLEGLKDRSPEGIKEHLKNTLGADLTDIEIDGKKMLALDVNTLSYRQTLEFDKIAFRSAGYSKVGSALRTRTIKIRQNLSLLPWKKADKWIADKADNYLESRAARKAEREKLRKQAIEEGKVDRKVADPKNKADKDADGRPDAPDETDTEIKRSTEDLDKVFAEESASPKTAKYTDITSSPAFKTAGIASLALGMVCMANTMSKEFDTIAYNKIAQPAIRLAMQDIASGEQIKAASVTGDPLDLEVMGFDSESFIKGDASLFAARNIQTNAGEKPTGPDLPPEAKINKDGNVLTQFLDSVKVVNPICDGVASGVGQVVSLAIDIVGGPVSAIVGNVAGSLFLPKIIDGFMNLISPDPLQVLKYAGPERGAISDLGAFLAANDSYLAAGGRPLTKNEAIAVKVRTDEIDNAEFAKRPLYARLFDYKDARSLLGRSMMNQSPSASHNLQNMASIFTNVGSSLRTVGTFFTGEKAKAATAMYDYGLPKIGFSDAEMNSDLYSDPMENAAKIEKFLKNDDNRKRMEKCTGNNISAKDLTITPGTSPPNYKDLKEYNCGDTSVNWTRARFLVGDTLLAEAYACKEGVDEEACANTGNGTGSQVGGSIGNDTSTPSTSNTDLNVALPSGTAIELAKKLLDYNKKGQVGIDKLSQVQNLADGKGPCPNVNGGQFTIDTKLLAVLVGLADKGNKFTISSLHRGCTNSNAGVGKKSRHWRGRAVDISGSRGINGVTMPSFGAYSDVIQNFINQAKVLLPAGCELGVANTHYKSEALKIQSPCTNVFLDTPETTNATGPHVHLGV